MEPARRTLDPTTTLTIGTLAANLGARMRGAAFEELHVAHIGHDGRLLGVRSAYGRADSVELPLRTILADALLQDAAGLVLVHNHPSGDPRPSRADCEATSRLADAGRTIGVRVVDHLVFGDGHWHSFRALGLL